MSALRKSSQNLLLAMTLIPASFTDNQARKTMSKFMDPPPNSEIEFFSSDLRELSSQQALKLRGFITIKPPKGICFTITKSSDKPDVKVCKETALSWRAEELAADGSLNWTISTGSEDFGRRYKWASKYRIAQTIALADKESITPKLSVVLGCTVQENASGHEVKLNVFRDRVWRLQIPKKHVPAKAAEAAHVAKAPEKPEAKPSPTPSPSKRKEATETWNLHAEQSYEMPSINFMTADGMTHPKGTCRYALKDAAGDKNYGWFECHYTGSFDIVFSHLPCKGLDYFN